MISFTQYYSNSCDEEYIMLSLYMLLKAQIKSKGTLITVLVCSVSCWGVANKRTKAWFPYSLRVPVTCLCSIYANTRFRVVSMSTTEVAPKNSLIAFYHDCIHVYHWICWSVTDCGPQCVQRIETKDIYIKVLYKLTWSCIWYSQVVVHYQWSDSLLQNICDFGLCSIGILAISICMS